MTDAEIRAVVLRILTEIAPEVDPVTVRPDINLRDQLDIDSMDFLNFLIGVDEALHVDIPETDYAQLATLDGCVAYVGRRLRFAAKNE